MTPTALLRELTARLGSASEARWLVEEVAPAGPGGRPGLADAPTRQRLEELVRRRLAGEPLQYLLGSWAFRTLDLAVDRRALIPRPETEQVVEVALEELATLAGNRGPATVVDLGTGSGAIALALATEAGQHRAGLGVFATDCDREALALAAENRLRVSRCAPWVRDQVVLVAGSWFGALSPGLRGLVDLVVTNPPYVEEAAWEDLPVEVRHEPRVALLAGPGTDGTPGLAALEAILEEGRRWLAPRGAVVAELSPEQAEPAVRCAQRFGYQEVEVRPDLSGRPRMVVARRR